MACFLVPAAEAAVVTVASHVAKTKEKKEIEKLELSYDGCEEHSLSAESIPLSKKLDWLKWFLWGGSFLLCYEHIWHGEITAWFPFLTAAATPADLAAMLTEMSTVGVMMAVLTTVAWAGIVLVAEILMKKANETEITTQRGEIR